MTEDSAPGISVIEKMAARQHESSGHIIRSWDQLSKEDRRRLMDAMETAVREEIPDTLLLKHGVGTATVRTGEARDAILADHDRAKGSALYGR